jgi:hypothetical protein
MAQLFPRWANSAVRAVLIVSAALLFGLPIALLAWTRTPAATGQYAVVPQPIPFSHPLHAGALQIDCRYCHAGAQRSAMAGLPPTRACVGCHSALWLSSAPFEPVRRSIQQSTPIPWRRVTAMPDFVFFNHAVHTRKGVGCESCHGRVDLMPQVYQSMPLTMGWCLECHRAPERYVRPVEAVTQMGWQAAADQDTQGRTLVMRYHVRPMTTCTSCHR